MGYAQLLRDFRHRLPLDVDGPQGFVATMPRILGLKKELFVPIAVHDVPPGRPANVSSNSLSMLATR
jgi:hypothetical protein